MGHFLVHLLASVYLFTASSAFVDFGTITQPLLFEPTFTVAVPRPHQLPDDVWMRYGSYYSQITAVAPSIRLLSNGSRATSWSLHSHVEPTRTTVYHGGLRRRGVFSGDPPIPTCRQCDKNGNPIDNGTGNNGPGSGTPTCSQVNYNGIFRSGGFASTVLPDYCFNAGYDGPLLPSALPSDAGLPCCPVCFPAGNSTGVITSGVLSTTTPLNPGTTPPIDDGSTMTETNTITATEPGTSTRVTLSVETITPTGSLGAPTIITRANTVKGCGTASGCGTVIGDGTVYLAPFGFPAVTSSGTVTGCAPTVIGCGTMIATTGTFTGTAEVDGCGEGRGCATMIGSGTVWPTGFMDMISFVSSGTVTGCGRVKGCGYLTGTGTFTVSEPYTSTATATPTVNVYVSYCPPEAGRGGGYNPLMRLAANFSGDASRYPQYDVRPNLSGGGNYTQLNVTRNATKLDNAMCHVCPEDSGICCPPFSDCGSDGHCPWSALEGSGYAKFGVNLVDMRNSSTSLGMGALPQGMGFSRLKAPGLPGSGTTPSTDQLTSSPVNGNSEGGYEEIGLSTAQKLRKRLGGDKLHEHVYAHARAPRLGLAHNHGHVL